MNIRNRSEGWSHAKLSGHKYEEDFSKSINKKEEFILNPLNEALGKIGKNHKIYEACCKAGKSKVNAFDYSTTTSKSDVNLYSNDDRIAGISVKKSESGQVQLCKLSRFTQACSYFTKKQIPDDAEWALKALTGETNGLEIERFAKGVSLTKRYKKGSLIPLEKLDNRLLAITLEREFPIKWLSLVKWFQENFIDLTKMVFSTGFCPDPNYWANIIHYRNNKNTSQPLFFTVDEIIKCKSVKKIGPSPGQGSTMWLPWGFMQVHRPTPKGKAKTGPFQLQFHHKLDRIIKNSRCD